MKRLMQIVLAATLLAGAVAAAAAEDLLKVAVPQRGSWDAGIPELGQRDDIFAMHGLKLEILYTSDASEEIMAQMYNSVDRAATYVISTSVGTFAMVEPL